MSIFLFSIIIILGIILLQSTVLKPNLNNIESKSYYCNPIYLNGSKQMYKHKSNRLRFSKKAKLKRK